MESFTPPPRDEVVDIAKGIGITLVVAGHARFVLSDFLSYSFHIPLFYFISGFFLHKYIIGRISRVNFIKRKFVTLLVPYFCYNLIFGLITYLLPFLGIFIQNGRPGIIPFTQIINLHTLLIEPFIVGWPFRISSALWFVPSLFLVMLLVCITKNIFPYIIKKPLRILFSSMLLVIIYYCCCNVNMYQHRIYGLICRTINGYVFCILGFFYYLFRQKFKPLPTLLIGVGIYSLLSSYYGPFEYGCYNNNWGIGIKKYLSLPVVMSGILIILSISNILVTANKFINKDGLMFLGRNSYHIMAVHPSFFILMNVLLVLFNPGLHLANIRDIYFELPNTAYLYFFFVLCGSYYYVIMLNDLKPSLLQKLSGLWSRDPMLPPG